MNQLHLLRTLADRSTADGGEGMDPIHLVRAGAAASLAGGHA